MPQHHKYANRCLFELAVDRQCDAASSPTLVTLLSRASLKSDSAISHPRRSAPLTHPRLHGDECIDYRADFYLTCTAIAVTAELSASYCHRAASRGA